MRSPGAILAATRKVTAEATSEAAVRWSGLACPPRRPKVMRPGSSGAAVDPRLDRRAAVVDEHAVEVDHPVRNARPVSEEEPQPERARRDPAQDLGRAVLGEPPEADDGRDPRGEKRPLELDLPPRRRQKARAVTGLLDRQDGQRRLGRARQADPDRAPGLEAQRRERRRQPADDLDGEGIAPFEPRPPAPRLAPRLIAERRPALVPACRRLEKAAEPHRPPGAVLGRRIAWRRENRRGQARLHLLSNCCATMRDRGKARHRRGMVLRFRNAKSKAAAS